MDKLRLKLTFRSSGMWLHVTGRCVADVLRQQWSYFKASKNWFSILLWTFDPGS